MLKKKIAVCSAQVPFVNGGAELHTAALIRELRARGYDVDDIKLPYKWYPNEQLINSMFAWKLLDLSESNGEKIDLVIPTKFPSYMVQHENKVVWLIHQYRQIYDMYGTKYSNFTEKDSDFMNLVKREDEKAFRGARKIFCNAKNTAGRLKRFNNIDGEHLYHPPMLYGRYFHESYGDYILSVGRLDAAKRIDMLIKAAKYTDKNVKILIAGRGPERENLEKLAQAENVADRVEFLGFVNDEDLLKLYANARAVYFAPFDEDYGYITLEAFFSHVPVITTKDAGGVLEFTEDNLNGFVCNTEPEEIGNAINKLFADEKLVKDFGEIGYQKVKDITWDYAIDRLTETIR